MVAWVRRRAARATADRKGSTGVEYALIGSAAAAILVGAFKPLFERIVTLLPTYIG
jgi:Flp pilus assembly pilin Flp